MSKKLSYLSILNYVAYFSYTYILFIMPKAFPDIDPATSALVTSFTFIGGFITILLWGKIKIPHLRAFLISGGIYLATFLLAFYGSMTGNFWCFFLSMVVNTGAYTVMTLSFKVLLHASQDEASSVENNAQIMIELGYLGSILMSGYLAASIDIRYFMILDVIFTLPFILGTWWLHHMQIKPPEGTKTSTPHNDTPPTKEKFKIYPVFLLVMLGAIFYEQLDWIAAHIYEQNFSATAYSIFVLGGGVSGIVAVWWCERRKYAPYLQLKLGSLFLFLGTVTVLFIPANIISVLLVGAGSSAYLASMRSVLMLRYSKTKSIQFAGLIANGIRVIVPFVAIAYFMQVPSYVYILTLGAFVLLGLGIEKQSNLN